MNLLTRYSPFKSATWDPLRELTNAENRLAQFLRGPLMTDLEKEPVSFSAWSPSVDISEDDKEFEVKAELPEVKKEDIKISVEEGALQISGERRMEKEEKGKRYHRVEREYGSFLRRFTLPEGADPAKIQAEFKDGVLHVHIAKTEKAKAKPIEIQVG
jgi:HSP20 family protein